jgi:hypothetical protein
VEVLSTITTRDLCQKVRHSWKICSHFTKALQAIYPEHRDTWRNIQPKGHWQDLNNQQQFFEKLAIKLNITKPSDWYKVTSNKVFEEGGTFIKKYYNGSLIQGTLCDRSSKRRSSPINYARD